jgi:hypothetical protein
MGLQWTLPARPSAGQAEPGQRRSGAPRMPRAQSRPAGEPPADGPVDAEAAGQPTVRRRADVAISLTTWRARLALLAPAPGAAGAEGTKRRNGN